MTIVCQCLTIIFLEFSQINAERDKERQHLDELNARLNCQIEDLESQKEKMNSDLHTLTIENEKHKEDLKKLKIQMKNLKSEMSKKSDKETQTDLSANQIEGKALAKKDQFITWLKNDNDFLNDEKNKLSDLVVELETHLGKISQTSLQELVQDCISRKSAFSCKSIQTTCRSCRGKNSRFRFLRRI